jgi:hypothetical protein
VYAAGLERKGKQDKSKGIYKTIAETLHENRASTDSEVKAIKSFKTLSKPSYEKILSLHGNMVTLLRKGTRSRLNFRSFVSKYLHFHTLIVSLSDSRASTTINRPDCYLLRRSNTHVTIPKRRKLTKE